MRKWHLNVRNARGIGAAALARSAGCSALRAARGEIACAQPASSSRNSVAAMAAASIEKAHHQKKAASKSAYHGMAAAAAAISNGEEISSERRRHQSSAAKKSSAAIRKRRNYEISKRHGVNKAGISISRNGARHRNGENISEKKNKQHRKRQ